jgi:hypothetical protein
MQDEEHVYWLWMMKLCVYKVGEEQRITSKGREEEEGKQGTQMGIGRGAFSPETAASEPFFPATNAEALPVPHDAVPL